MAFVTKSAISIQKKWTHCFLLSWKRNDHNRNSMCHLYCNTNAVHQGLQILLTSGVSLTSASQILESFWNIWSQASQWKKPLSDFPARCPCMYTLLWAIHEVAVAVRWPGKLKSMAAFIKQTLIVIYPLPVLSCSIYNSLVSITRAIIGQLSYYGSCDDLIIRFTTFTINTNCICCEKGTV